MFEYSTEILALLAIAAFAAGFVDAIAGGGGLIALPALLLSGMSPVEALGTNKMQGLFGTGSAAFNYARRGHVDLKAQAATAGLSFIASAAGAITATFTPPELLKSIMPWVLVAIALFFWLKPGMSDENKAARVSMTILSLTLIPIIAFYDGIFGPGAGSFYMLVFVLLAGQGILKATAHTKLLNFASNVGGFVIFASLGSVAWGVGIAMAIAQVMGALAGSSIAMKNGAKLIKPLLVIVCIAMALRLWLA